MRQLPKPRGRYHDVELLEKIPAPKELRDEKKVIWAHAYGLPHAPEEGTYRELRLVWNDMMIHADGSRSIFFRAFPNVTMITGRAVLPHESFAGVTFRCEWSDYLQIIRRRKKLAATNRSEREPILAIVVWPASNADEPQIIARKDWETVLAGEGAQGVGT